jgi:hypothetical protein
MIKIETTVEHSNKLNMMACITDEETVDTLKLKPGGRYIGKIGDVEWRFGLLNYGDGKLYIMMSKSRLNDINAEEGDEITIEALEDKSEYGADMPEEFQVLLDQDEDFSRRFHAQTKGFQRTIIIYISRFKTESKRLEHAMRLMRNILAFPTDKVNMGQAMRQK